MREPLRLPVSDSSLAVTVEGSGPPVLLLHGIGSSRESFDRQFPLLARRYRCIAWDAPGYGASEDPVRAPGMDGYAAAAATVLRQLGAVPAHVLGVSWGGVIATRLALAHPGSVRSLILADSTRGAGASPDRGAAMRARGDELDVAGPWEFAVQRAPRLLSPNAPAALVHDVAAAMAQSIRNPGYCWAAEAMADTDHLDALHRLEIPTLVLVGEHDTVTTVEASRELATTIPGARLEVIPGAGHLANQERPSNFNDLLVDFLDEIERDRERRPAAHTSGGSQAT